MAGVLEAQWWARFAVWAGRCGKVVEEAGEKGACSWCRVNIRNRRDTVNAIPGNIRILKNYCSVKYVHA